MRWIDLLRMSSGNLKKRKLRTFLTILGVVIGTASIVVMISLGLGMQQSMYKQIEQAGGMTAITVTGQDAGGGMYYFSNGSEEGEATKYVTDDAITEIEQLEHVKSVTPSLTMSSVILSGNYYGYIQLVGMTPDELERQNMELVEGSRMPETNSASLELVIGNMVPMDFYEKGSNKGYWETQQLPDIDFMKDPVFLVLSQEDYFNAQSGTNSGTFGSEENSAPVKAPKKYVVQASGRMSGGIETYHNGSYEVYCDIWTLKNFLQKEYRGRAIPGQPKTQTGKPYKFFAYTNAMVQADDIDHVEDLAATIQGMGYRTSTNAEYLKSAQQEFAMIEAVLGGIGAVSLFVAAIGIANTMMMSIYERTKEIGVIKVLGCSLRNIKQMFLLEAAFIGFIGGLAGNILSFLLSFAINVVTAHGGAMGLDSDISYIPVWLVAASMGFAVLVGMVAGYFPALRAMRLSPLAAIRNE